MARANLKRLPFGDNVSVTVKDFRDLPGLEKATIVANPPYGVRLGSKKEVSLLYREFGSFLRQR